MQRTFDSWVDRDAGCLKAEEELYELQVKVERADAWQMETYTDYDGNPCANKDVRLSLPP